MRPDPIEGEPRRKLIAVTRRRVALAAAAVLAALWLAIVGQLKAGSDPFVKDTSNAAAPATTTTTTPETTTTQTSTDKSSSKTETEKTETTETQTTTTSTSASTSTSSQS
jgi:hypothetical protein